MWRLSLLVIALVGVPATIFGQQDPTETAPEEDRVAPRIVTKDGQLVFEINAGDALYVEYQDGEMSGQMEALATEAALDPVKDIVEDLRDDLSNVNDLASAAVSMTFYNSDLKAKLEAAVNESKAYLDSSEAADKIAAHGFAMESAVTDLNRQLGAALESIASLNETVEVLRNAPSLVQCDELTIAANSKLTMTEQYERLAGTVVSFGCSDTSLQLEGAHSIYCKVNGKWSDVEPKCVGGPGKSKATAKANCREIWKESKSKNIDVPSGTYWIQPEKSKAALEVYCDMVTESVDGTSGWTLCGKYDRDGKGSRWLENGFLRSAYQVAKMKVLAGVGSSKKWASIDCRRVIDGKYDANTRVTPAAYMMHAAAASASKGYTRVRFNNIMTDVRSDATNLFDISKEDQGSCKDQNNGGITSWDKEWHHLVRDEGNNLGAGGCLTGQGTMFCTRSRKGARFSNAGTSNCQGSTDDTVYWSFIGKDGSADDHGCAINNNLIGTGCAQRAPTWRYNFLFVL